MISVDDAAQYHVVHRQTPSFRKRWHDNSMAQEVRYLLWFGQNCGLRETRMPVGASSSSTETLA